MVKMGSRKSIMLIVTWGWVHMRPVLMVTVRALIVYKNILRFSQDSMRSTLAGHFQSRENEKMPNLPLVAHHFQVDQCARQ